MLETSVLFTLQLPPPPTLFPYTTLFRSAHRELMELGVHAPEVARALAPVALLDLDAAHRQRRARRAHSAEALTVRSEEHTSELQSHSDLVCRLLLEKKKEKPNYGYLIGN